MAIIKCKMCGGDLNITAGVTVAECEFCGTQQTLPKANDEIIQNLFNRANSLRIKCEFDKAEQIYEKILQENNSEAEAHWGIVLCKYGIEYVEDPKTYKRIPTCHRTSYDAVTADADYQAAVAHADAVQKGIYEVEAKAIDAIQKDILNIVKNEKPFDVFICYKETDENGKRTQDSVIANDIYYQLTQEGMKVFYAAITLEDKLGQEYEPYIFAALNSAKVMLVIGTKPQHFSAVWVKNEWSRFLKLMKADRSKLLIPCYRDMDAYELPEEFAHLQAQDMSKIGFINDVVRGIKKVAVKEETPAPVVTETVVTAANANTAPLLQRAFIFLEDGDWNSADEYCEKVLDLEPQNAQAYLGKLMAELRVKKQELLKDQAEPFDQRNNFQKVVRFADEDLRAMLVGCVEHIKIRNETNRQQNLYSTAKSIMSAAKTGQEFLQAANKFAEIGDYLDAAELAKTCREQGEIARKDAILAAAKLRMNTNAIVNYEAAIDMFKSIHGWKDADELIAVCQKKIEEIKEKDKALRLERERMAELQRQEEERLAKRNTKIVLIVLGAFAVAMFFVMLFVQVIIPNGEYKKAVALMDAGKYDEAIVAFGELHGYKDSLAKINESKEGIQEQKYNDAIALMDSGKFAEAYASFVELNGYKDSLEKANAIYEQHKVDILKTAEVGDYVIYGTYEQDNNTNNGQEAIEWLVLDVKGDRMLVISKYALDSKQFNKSSDSVTWEDCAVRDWLNNYFVNTAFTSEEQARIPTVTAYVDRNPDYGTLPGNATKDQVFLLSVNEVRNYFVLNIDRQCEITAYAASKATSNTQYTDWWLRTPGVSQRRFTYVATDGSIKTEGNFNTQVSAIRPAMWIDLSE